MTMSSDMQKILADVAEEFAQTEVFNQWMPPDGNYTALITAYGDGVSAKGGNKVAWWKLDARLLVPGDEELDEKDFTLGFYRSSAIGFLKQAMAVLAGRKVDDISQAEPVLSASVGMVVNISKTTTIRSDAKGGGEFPNVKILEVVQQPGGGGGDGVVEALQEAVDAVEETAEVATEEVAQPVEA